MEASDYWRLCDELSISQAADLLVGMFPGEVDALNQSGAELTTSSLVAYTTNRQAALAAIRNAIAGARLPGTLRFEINANWDSISECMVEEESDVLDIERTTVLVDDLKIWLRGRGLRSGFFFPEEKESPDYLNSAHPRYAPKLAAAVSAWQAAGADLNGKTPKQALAKWLREHAAEFGMTDDEGKPNETGIEEAAKVANWQPGGGAPKTPGE